MPGVGRGRPYYSDEWLTIHEGDARAVLREMEPESVNCVVTSPPYWGLRDYGSPGQLGLEKTPEEYVAAIVDVFREVRRVLRADGTLWLNLGDSYYRDPGRGDQEKGGHAGLHTGRSAAGAMQQRVPGLREKNLLGIPWRVALALQADGWYLRSEIIWAKGWSFAPDAGAIMPDPTKDRPTRSHETVFLLTRSPRYFYDHAAVREPSVSEAQQAHNARYARTYDAFDSRAPESGQPGNENNRGLHSRPGGGGRSLRTVWRIGVSPYPGDHYAVFPERLIEPMMLAGCPEGGVVLDPFAGTGTVGMVAQRLSRRAVLIDLNADYLAQCLARNAQTPLGLPA